MVVLGAGNNSGDAGVGGRKPRSPFAGSTSLLPTVVLMIKRKTTAGGSKVNVIGLASCSATQGNRRSKDNTHTHTTEKQIVES